MASNHKKVWTEEVTGLIVNERALLPTGKGVSLGGSDIVRIYPTPRKS